MMPHGTLHGAVLDATALIARRLGFWLWSGAQPRLSYACPKGGDWRLEVKDICVAFPEVCCVSCATACSS